MPLNVRDYQWLKAQIKQFDDRPIFAPRYWLNRLLGISRDELAAKLIELDAVGHAEQRHLERTLTGWTRLLHLTESSATFPGVRKSGFGLLRERVAHTIELIEWRIGVIHHLRSPDLEERLADGPPGPVDSRSGRALTHELLKACLDDLRSRPELPPDAAPAIKTEVERVVGYLQRDDSPVSGESARALGLLESIIGANRAISSLSGREYADKVVAALRNYMDIATDLFEAEDPRNAQEAVNALGSRRDVLGALPRLAHFVAPLPPPPADNAPVKKGGSSPDRGNAPGNTRSGDTVSASLRNLQDRYDLPSGLLRDLLMRWGAPSLEDRCARLDAAVPRAAPAFIRSYPEVLGLSAPRFDEFISQLGIAGTIVHQIDPQGILRSLTPVGGLAAFTPATIERTLATLGSLATARELLASGWRRFGVDGETGWRAFLEGTEQILSLGGEIAPEGVAFRLTQVYLPHNFPHDVAAAAIRRLTTVINARNLEQIQRLPGNRLEIWEQTRHSQPTFFVRINDAWRIGFIFAGNRASEVSIVNYH